MSRRDLKRWPKTEGFPVVSRGGDLKRYYDLYISELHPEWSKRRIKREVKTAIQHDQSLWKEMEAIFEEEATHEAYQLIEAFQDITRRRSEKRETHL